MIHARITGTGSYVPKKVSTPSSGTGIFRIDGRIYYLL